MLIILDFILHLDDFLLFLYLIWRNSKELVLSELSMDDFIQIIYVVRPRLFDVLLLARAERLLLPEVLHGQLDQLGLLEYLVLPPANVIDDAAVMLHGR